MWRIPPLNNLTFVSQTRKDAVYVETLNLQRFLRCKEMSVLPDLDTITEQEEEQQKMYGTKYVNAVPEP